jgi:hypothetical protein
LNLKSNCECWDYKYVPPGLVRTKHLYILKNAIAISHLMPQLEGLLREGGQRAGWLCSTIHHFAIFREPPGAASPLERTDTPVLKYLFQSYFQVLEGKLQSLRNAQGDTLTASVVY